MDYDREWATEAEAKAYVAGLEAAGLFDRRKRGESAADTYHIVQAGQRWRAVVVILRRH